VVSRHPLPKIDTRPKEERKQPAPRTSEKVVPSSEEDHEALSDVAVKNAPPWLISLLVHIFLMLLLALIVLPQFISGDQLEATFSEQLGKQLERDLGVFDESETLEVAVTPEELNLVEDPLQNLINPIDFLEDGTNFISEDPARNAIGLALEGRTEGSKESLLGKYGGTALTEEAVQRGLAWLARNQQRDGSWKLTGPYRDGVDESRENRSAATAMALLAFQGNGNTTLRGQYRDEVERGWNWLLKQQDDFGCFFRRGQPQSRFYTQGQCLIALCELYAMTHQSEYRLPAEKAIEYCLKNQSSSGGWKYFPGGRSDTSVTGWVLMGLQSARMAGLTVDPEALERVDLFLNTVANGDGSRYAYEPGYPFTKPMTAEALLCRQYLGWKKEDPRLQAGLAWLTSPENRIDYSRDPDVYYWYYAAQVAHHMGHRSKYWQRWNEVMRQRVPEMQIREGNETGSWDPSRDAWGQHGGRLYVTCLSIYMLEVYYRHLPIYRDIVLE
jgi:hypothetical protein